MKMNGVYLAVLRNLGLLYCEDVYIYRDFTRPPLVL